MSGAPWPARDAEMLQLVAEGLSYGEVARRMGLSKNSVVGRAHRLALPLRPRPIREKGSGAKPKGQGLPVLEGAQRNGWQAMEGDTLAALGVAPAVPAQARRAEVVVLPVAQLKPKPCCWPIGEPRTKAFRYCEALGVPGKPYCAEHYAIAYQPMYERTEAQREAGRVRAAKWARRHVQSPLTKWGG